MPVNDSERRAPMGSRSIAALAISFVLVGCAGSSPQVAGTSAGSASGAATAGAGASGAVGQAAGAGSSAGAPGAGGAGSSTGAPGTAGSGGAAGSTGQPGSAGATSGTLVALSGSDAGTGASTGADGGGASSLPEASTPTGASEGGITLPPITGPVKIMVLGSSNEIGSCWRAFLWQKLHDAGVTNFHFIGSVNAAPGCPGVATYDAALEAHNGWIIEDLSDAAWLAIFKANPPDIVLEHNGGADLLTGHPYANVIKAYTAGVTAARMVNPRVIYLAAQHTPQMPDNADVMALNAAMVPWAAGITTAASPVAVVDLFTGINMATDMSDGVHLNDMGSEKVSDKWLAALLPILKP